MLVVCSVVLQWSQFCIPCGFADRWWRLRLRSPSCLFWFRRNRVVHGTPLLSLKETVGWSELYLADFQAVAAVLGVRLGLVVERWRVPRPGWVKINSDVAVDIRGRRLGFGVVFRDSTGKRGGYSVRLASQSSDYLPLLAVKGSQAGAIWSQHWLAGLDSNWTITFLSSFLAVLQLRNCFLFALGI
ncbi:hypothetical protein ACOSQ4_032202 [Xanthoceras sorbifolium]